jgi:hypothetical protein
LSKCLEPSRGVACLGGQIDRTTERRAAIAERVRALVDLDRLGGQELQRLKVGKAVRVAIGHPVNQYVDAAKMEVVSEP